LIIVYFLSALLVLLLLLAYHYFPLQVLFCLVDALLYLCSQQEKGVFCAELKLKREVAPEGVHELLVLIHSRQHVQQQAVLLSGLVRLFILLVEAGLAGSVGVMRKQEKGEFVLADRANEAVG
jgi:hypothetical protein